jgi:serine/threonine protein kinase
MGTVYRAQSRDGRLYAVKTLHPWLSQSDDMNRRFRREARAAARLEGPHTVRVQDSGELPDGTLFIVMELVDGESLTDRVEREGWLDAPTTLRILRQLALGLAEAHALGLVHRDLKPDNIYLTPGPAGDHVKILDFGIVKYLDAALGTIGQTDTGRVFGTPEYMSPEQARGDPDLDHRSDIFSAGILAFVCLTGRLPWEGADPRAAMVRRLTEDAPRVTAVRRDLEVPAALVDLVARMLARVPADRPTWPRWSAPLTRSNATRTTRVQRALPPTVRRRRSRRARRHVESRGGWPRDSGRRGYSFSRRWRGSRSRWRDAPTSKAIEQVVQPGLDPSRWGSGSPSVLAGLSPEEHGLDGIAPRGRDPHPLGGESQHGPLRAWRGVQLEAQLVGAARARGVLRLLVTVHVEGHRPGTRRRKGLRPLEPLASGGHPAKPDTPCPFGVARRGIERDALLQEPRRRRLHRDRRGLTHHRLAAAPAGAKDTDQHERPPHVSSNCSRAGASR